MWNKFSTTSLSIILIIAFSIAITFSSNYADAQSLWKVNSDTPPSGTTTTNTDESSNSSTIIYVAMGVAVVGALLYKFVFKKNKGVDSTSTEHSSSLLLPGNSGVAEQIVKNNLPVEQPPVNLFFGVLRNNAVSEEKTYVLGLSFKF